MDVQMLTDFFMWCTIVNFGLMIISFLILAFAGDLVYNVHGRWFPMTREAFNVVAYSFLGVYKILVIFFNVVPWAALAIVG